MICETIETFRPNERKKEDDDEKTLNFSFGRSSSSSSFLIDFIQMKSIRCLTRFPSLNKSLIRFSSSNDSTNVQLDFEKAKKRLESSSIDVDNETKLKLYGLFKQSTQGVCSTSKPALTDFVGRAKWTSWSSLGQLSKIDAQKQYIQLIDQLTSSSSSSRSF